MAKFSLTAVSVELGKAGRRMGRVSAPPSHRIRRDKEEAAELRAQLFSRVGIFCCTSLIGAERVDVVGVGGDFGEGADVVGGDEGIAEVLEDGDVVSGGSAFAKAAA